MKVVVGLRAVQLYALMKLPNEQEARRILRRVGCEDDNKETIVIS